MDAPPYSIHPASQKQRYNQLIFGINSVTETIFSFQSHPSSFGSLACIWTSSKSSGPVTTKSKHHTQRSLPFNEIHFNYFKPPSTS
ncbi:hypothetical protein VTL71DRAFT_14766 [Oculimacula yallundae]|uniref:Uncharacterized protein n=1 Tax=Oculimacula yallundae TaxID=86028 RepID=A0ABR4CKR9_9HELO